MEFKIGETKEDDFDGVKTMDFKFADTGVFVIEAKAVRFNGVMLFTGKGSPLNVIAAPLGSFYLNQNGGANTCIYVKETETLKGDSTGWVAK